MPGFSRAFLVRIAAVIAVSIILAFAAHGYSKSKVDNTWPPLPRLDMEKCIENLKKTPNNRQEISGSDSVNSQISACYSLLWDQGSLDDFQIRRSKYYQQNYADTIILWMVVAITFSGVALAALQILISYRITANNGKGTDLSDNEFVISKGRISLKSSVAGIMILALSLGFFWLFVKDVYTMKESNPDPDKLANQRNSSSSVANLNYGPNTIGTFGVTTNGK